VPSCPTGLCTLHASQVSAAWTFLRPSGTRTTWYLRLRSVLCINPACEISKDADRQRRKGSKRVCAAGTFWMERRCSSGSIGERLTPATRTDAGASKSDLRLRSARLPFSTPASMIAGIVLVDDHTFLYLSSTKPLPGLMAFFKFLSFRMQLFQDHTLHHKPQCNLSRFMVLFLCFFFSDIVIGHLGDQCAFALIVLIFLRFCMNFPPPSPPPSQFCTYTTISFLLRRSRRYGHRSTHVCFYSSFDAFMTVIDRLFCLPLLLIPIIVRYRQHGHYLRCPKWAGRDFRVQSMRSVVRDNEVE
jgi:hypothetical protein